MYRIIFVFIIVGWPALAVAAEPEWLSVLRPQFQRIESDDAGARMFAVQSESIAFAAGSVRSLPDPMFGIGLQAVPTDGVLDREPMTQAPMLSFRQAIPYPGSRIAAAEIKSAHSDVVSAQQRAYIESSALRLARAAFELDQLAAEMQAVDETLNWFELLAKSIAARYRSGRGTGRDVDQLQVEIGRLHAERSRLQASAQAARAEWADVLDGYVVGDLTMPPPEVWQPPRNVTEIVLSAHPWLAVNHRKIDAEQAREKQAKSGYGPDFALELGYGVRHNNRRDFMTAKLGVSLPLWAAWSQRNDVAAARKAVAASELALTDARAAVMAQLDRLLAVHRDARHRQYLYQQSILPDAETARASARADYEAGGADIFVPIEAVRREMVSRREFARVVAERRGAEAALLAVQGRLISSTKLTADRSRK